MLKSWILLMASDHSDGTPPSGAAAQQAVWPEESVHQSTARSRKDDYEYKSRKAGGTDSRKTACAWGPDRDVGYGRGGRTAGWSDDKPAFQAVDAWRTERTEECLI